MVTATKGSNDSSNSLDRMLSSFTSNTKASKSSFETSKASSNGYTSKKDDFKNVLKSESDSKVQDNTQSTSTVDEKQNPTGVEDTDINNTDELNEKLEELEKESKSASEDKMKDILSELLSLLSKLGIKQDNISEKGVINSKVGGNETNSTSSNSGLNGIMEKIMELLKNDSVKSKLDSNSLNLIEKLLGNLNYNIKENATESTKGNLKGIMSEISDLLENKQNVGNKVLTLEDMLSKNYSQDNSESEDSSASKNNTPTVSKEEKFLNSLVDDNKDDSLNKINLFASRTSAIQNQSVNNARGLTINKATFADDLIKDVKFMNTNSLKELTVKVNPGNLGEITIKLVQEDGLIKANLKANSKETSALISQNLSDIKKQLGEQNLKIADVNIELYQDDTTFFNEQSFSGQLSEEQRRNNTRNSNTGNDLEGSEEDLVDNIGANDNNIEFFA
ncbi:flagellar hook-length control protein FliK [Clostridium beijerinckii]|jgi:Flagellar hook-length control protein|uniref:Flagellar hook-length control protein FliK n=2 Tax=Clostridium beijerinckii TaxID=1520 RepID=A0AAE2RRM9_CLOBE|nr:flagellar hook-length control protein FliK [Clostridium beijerinckii]ABR36373.1 flagellar hook-length control protein [Clostridium beijerinckii NCIMB 8052]AIU02276.1 flagellar hook-length control protein [Clostridium beijerinckii ATCC 35702]MBF7808981.1 flagellar hook-length control protein FliK [Clostridium beijerinckii]MCI1477698.1 flagellar hook-length control protein FliK [Clostridium beijerinckii]MCI1577986.1 flagellar hook-length control protein FliK [Clostridium beijerinckii]